MVTIISDSGVETQQIQLTKLSARSGRLEISLNSNWDFHRGPLDADVNRSGNGCDEWGRVDLPHTWNALDGYSGGNDYFRGDGWYRKTIRLDGSLAGRRFYLHFDGANLIADLYVDGRHVGQHRGGYSAFRFDLTELLRPGEDQLLAVKVNNERHEDVAPLSADFTFFGGIYRDVKLLVTRQEHIDVMDHASPGVFLHQKSLSDQRARIDVQVNLINHATASLKRLLRIEIADADGSIVARREQPVALRAGCGSARFITLEIDQPRRWDGIRDPYLYAVTVSLLDGETLVDSLRQPLGLREFKVDAVSGLFLNGSHYDVRGVSRHQDSEGKGWALSADDHRRDVEMIEELGASAVRLAHYQHAPCVYDLMDEKGLVTWAEIPLVNEVPATEAFERNVRSQLLELVRQNYNHPSILFWGICNEVSLCGMGADSFEILKGLQALAKSEDPGRLTTNAVLGRCDGEDIWFLTDIVAENTYFGWYYDAAEDLGRWADRARQAYPQRAFGVSEYGAGAGVGIHSDEPHAGDHSEEYQSIYHEISWLQMRRRPYLWSKFIWNMFDFAVDSRDEGERAGINDKGLVTYDRKIRKDSFFWYKANWSRAPVLYITSRRFNVRKRPCADIKIYSNLERVELLVNGRSLGVRQVEDCRVIFPAVGLAMGDNCIEAKAVDRDSHWHSDQVHWQRIDNDDTDIAASNGVIGVDLDNRRIYHLPYGTSVAELEGLIKLPFGAVLDVSAIGSAGRIVRPGDRFAVVAANGRRREYTVARGALSVARPVRVNKELLHGIFGYPAAPAVKVVDGNDSFPLEQEKHTASYWLTGDANQGSGHLRIDLGADYFIHRLDSAWLPPLLTENGVCQYTVEVARDLEPDATVFVEHYDMVVDRRRNREPLRTADAIGRCGRFVRINILDSSYKVELPLLGSFRLFGATQFTVSGGLLYSEHLAVDYDTRCIVLPCRVTVAELRDQLRVVGQGSELKVTLRGEPASDHMQVTEHHGVLVKSRNKNSVRREYYDIRR
ncbi:glycoside hydrolase family 2 protein [Microbulbifer magnicolonia]|uniref:glycoside hydrolase family 2 protein n=1 Tax=Microbulbifer magnicolonia TaxID=3109744 RepID=UPI002B411FFF|nr:glycoside hydrolase family 2 TIM barrel-domain containing protein [Microbulbifer sp. GG15]